MSHKRNAGGGHPESRLPVSLVALSAAGGVLLASLAYTAGRLQHGSPQWNNRAYWAGQALILVPVALRLIGRRRLTGKAAVTLVVVLTISEYLLKVCYSPLGFTFGDELLHWRTTVNVLHTGKLTSTNYGLPISPHYPGLEEVTSALCSLTGLSVFTAGLIAAGVAHLLFVCLLYMLFHGVSRSHRIAGIAILIYYSTPGLTSFNSMFVYETLALAFMGLAIHAARKTAARIQAGERAGWFAVAVLATGATVITHHVTSYLLVGVLLLVTVSSLVLGFRNSAIWLGILTFVAGIIVALWALFAAPQTMTYFSPFFDGFLQSFQSLMKGGSSHAPPTSAAPLGNQALEGVAVLTITLLLPPGWWQVWRSYRHQPWVAAMALGSAGWYVALVTRLVVADGQELAGRVATFLYIPVSFIAAFVLARVVSSGVVGRWRRTAVAAACAGVLTLLLDGLANGWPPYWERLPGPHQVAGVERSVGPLEIATARWALARLGPGNRFAADFGIEAVLSGYGYQDPLSAVGYLYSSPRLTLADELLTQQQAVRYVLVDKRLSQSRPADGSFFGGGPGVTRPIPPADLAKFNDLPGVARVYDSGTIVIYDLRGAQYAR